MLLNITTGIFLFINLSIGCLGGVDDIVGLSRETGISQQGISNAVDSISPGDIRQLDDKLGTNLVESLFGKGKELIANVSKTLNLLNTVDDIL